MKPPQIPPTPNAITKGVPLYTLLDKTAVEYLANNLRYADESFDRKGFIKVALKGIDRLGILDRGKKIAVAMKDFLPSKYSDAIAVMLKSLTPPLINTENNGLAVFFYLPHVCFVGEYGMDRNYNRGEDPFSISMDAQYQLTKRFSSEFSIRPFLIHQQDKTLKVLKKWCKDEDPHVRRLCSEGTRPRLPWAIRLPNFIYDPSPVMDILEMLKNDDSLYVRRSVANHLGDIAKDHPKLIFDLCRNWLEEDTGRSNKAKTGQQVSKELKWVIRHALRYPAKKNVTEAIKLREQAK